MKKCPWKRLLILFLLTGMVCNHFYKNVTSGTEYAFSPESQMRWFYRDYKDSQEAPSSPEDAKSRDFSVIARTEPYYQNLRYSRFIGKRDPERGLFLVAMNWYPPDEETEVLNIVKDQGDVIYNKDSGLGPCKFVCLTGRYKNADIRNHALTITHNGNADACVLGCVKAIYITPDKKKHFVEYASAGEPIVIPTRMGWGFLNDFCIFHAYRTPDTYPAPNPSITYEIKRGETVIMECRFQE